MADFITLSDPKVTVYIRRNPRARRMTLRLYNRDGRFGVSVPVGTPLAQVEQFISSQRAWLARYGVDQPLKPLDFGQSIHLNGRLVDLCQGAVRHPMVEPDAIILSGPNPKIGAQLRALFKIMARDQMAPIAQSSAMALGCQINAINFRDPATRWGSCSARGRIMLSWRLVMAPLDVQTYVAVHEVCHLREMNHSARFWSLVEQQLPDYRRSQTWLREHGRILQRYPL